MWMRQGCLLSPSGFCEDMTSYKYKADYRRNLTASELRSSGWYNYFPSINSTYCEASDAACVLCDELVANGSSSYNMGWDAGNASTEEYRQFCLGTDGCVCVMACESSDWADNMMADCDNPASSVDSDSTDVSSYTTLLPLFFVLQIMLLGAFVYRRMLLARLLRSQPPAQAEGPYNNVNAISSPSNRLRLSGWRKMQNDLIDKERKQGLFSLRSPRPDATATAAGADYEIASPAILRPSASPAPPTGEVVETSLDDRNSIAVLEERPGANSVASEHQTRNPRNSV